MTEFKVGDEVTVFHAFGNPESLRKIKRVTTRTVILSDDTTWSVGGRPWGDADSWYTKSIRLRVTNDATKIRQAILAERLKRTNWNVLPLTTLERAWKALSE